MAIERHLERVATRLPSDAAGLVPGTDAADAVILHLWQATQAVIDLATAACLEFKLGAPATYADAFERLRQAGVINDDLTTRLKRAAGFRNVVAHLYDRLDMGRVWRAAHDGPADLRRFLVAVRDRLTPPDA